MKFPAVLLVLALAVALVGALLGARPQDPPAPGPPVADEAPDLVASLAAAGLRIDFERGLVGLPARVLVRHDLLEYLLVSPSGSAHESLFETGVEASVLNAALLALGAEAGTNATWTPKDPPPTDEERRAGVNPYVTHKPAGDGFLLYAAWREGDDTYFFRVEDLLSNLATGRSMRRHRWVYLGSRFIRLKKDGPELFAADVEGNFINVAWFHEGNTLLTAALDECVDQQIWLANSWLVPPGGSPLQLILARDELFALDDAWVQSLPVVEVPSDERALGR